MRTPCQLSVEAATPRFRREYVRQRPTDLVLSVYGERVPALPEWVLAERRVALGGWRLHVQIVGASHVVVIDWGEGALTEALVAHPVHAGAARPVWTLPAGGKGELHAAWGRCTYSVTVVHQEVAAHTLRGWHERLLAEGPCRISAPYPAPEGDLPGITSVSWELHGNDLHLHTQHTYPDDAVIVTTAGVCRLDG